MAETIGNMTPAELQRFIQNLLLNDPAALPKQPQARPQGLTQEAATNGQVLAWNGFRWVPTSLNYSDQMVVGQTSSGGSTPTNILANVTAISAVTMTLRGNRPIGAFWNGGAVSNSSGVGQNIQMHLRQAGTQFGVTMACYPQTVTLPNGSTAQLPSFSSFIPAGLTAGSTQFDLRFSVGDGSTSIQFVPNSWNNPGILTVYEF